MEDGGDAVEETLSQTMDRRLRIEQSSQPSQSMGGYAQQQQQQQQQASMPSSSSAASRPKAAPMEYSLRTEEKKFVDSDEDDSDFDSDFDDDPALEAFRQRRLAELKQSQAKEAENKAKGHGEVRTISQDEFLPECTGSSKFVTVHFYHDEFERCKIMDHHLKIIAPLHLSCKFVRINAEKTPFFVAKLAIKTLPTLVVFKDGKTIDRLMGFEGLSNSKDPDRFTTSALGRWLEHTGAIEYEGPDSEDEEESSGPSNTRTGMMASRFSAYDEDF